MKKVFLLAIAALAGAVACTGERLEPQNGENVIFTVCSENTAKTCLDGLEILWENSDKIVVNGQESLSTTVAADGRSASFVLPAVQAPYLIVSPASASREEDKISLPAVQNFRSGSYDAASAVMLYDGSSTEVTFSHAMAYIRLTVTSSHAHQIAAIKLTAAGGEQLSGEFSINKEKLSLEGISGSSSVTMRAAIPVAAGTSFTIAVPAATYTQGLSIRIIDSSNHYQDLKSQSVFDAKAGHIYPTTIDFVPTGTLINAGIEEGDMSTPVKILFIGNSHTLDATDLLPEILNHEGVRNLELTRVYHGGYYLVGYNANYDKANNCSICTWRSGENMWRGVLDLTYTLRDAVEANSYDYVVMQEYAGNAHCWSWDDAERNAISGIIEKIRVTSPNAKIYYYLSHCFATGYSVLVDNFSNDHTKQFESCIENNLKHVMDPAEGFPFVGYISTCALIENLRTSPLNKANTYDMFRGDYLHLDYGMTRIAASLLFWKTLFTPLTGIKIEDISYRLNEYYPNPTKHVTPFTDQNRPTVLAAVEAAYNDPLHITDLSGVGSLPSYVNIPGSNFLDQTGVDVDPVSFPLAFRIGYNGGAQVNTGTSQGLWHPCGLWKSSQPQAFAKWVSVSTPVEGIVYDRNFANASPDKSSVAWTEAWTGDYMEFVIPVKNFAAGSSIRFDAPMYTREGPRRWAMDYLDGDQWKTAADEIVLGYETTAVSVDMPFEKALKSGFLRFRLRVVDGREQISSTGVVYRDTPYMSGGEYAAVIYFYGPGVKQVTFTKH